MGVPKLVLEEAVPAVVVAAEDNAVNVVLAVAQARLVRPDHLDSPEILGHQEHPDSPGDRNKRHANKPLSHRANHAQVDSPASPDLQDHQANLEHQASRELVAGTHNQDHRDRLAHRDSPEVPASQVDLDSQGNRLNRNKLAQHLLAHQERLVLPDSPEMLDHLANPAALANLDRKDHLAHLDNQETKEHQGSRDNPGKLEAEAKRAFARSTAPSTGACSSRTAPDGVKQAQRCDKSAAVSYRKKMQQNVYPKCTFQHHHPITCLLLLPTSASSIIWFMCCCHAAGT